MAKCQYVKSPIKFFYIQLLSGNRGLTFLYTFFGKCVKAHIDPVYNDN